MSIKQLTTNASRAFHVGNFLPFEREEIHCVIPNRTIAIKGTRKTLHSRTLYDSTVHIAEVGFIRIFQFWKLFNARHGTIVICN